MNLLLPLYDHAALALSAVLCIIVGHLSTDHGDKLEQDNPSSLSWSYALFTGTIGVLLLLNALNIFRTVAGIDTAIILTIVGGYRIFSSAIGGLFRGKISLDFIVFVAAISALSLGENIAAAEVIFIMLIGEGLEDYTVRKARNAIRGLVALVPRVARLKIPDGDREVPIAEINENDVIIVRPGEKIPVDGAVVAGQSSVNQATITGESISVGKMPGDEVYTGTINELGLLEIRVTAVGPDTVLSKIIHLIEEAQDKKAPVQRSADRFAKYFLPIVATMALLTWYVSGDVIRAVAVLIIACPCAMVLATPAAVVAGIGRLARDGILIKGGEFLETIGKVTCVVFDKTGTLTTGTPVIAAIHPFGQKTENDLLRMAAAAEQHTTHLLADLIVREARSRNLAVDPGDDFTLIPGMGVEILSNGKKLLVGNRKLLADRGVTPAPDVAKKLDVFDDAGQTLIIVAEDDTIAGVITVEDTLRDGIPETIADLQAAGITRLVVLTGDNAKVARKIARRSGIPEFMADLLPGQKVDRIRELQADGHRVVMIGDGINDAPALATADVGIAMGGIGADITADAADIVFMHDDLHKLPDAIHMGRRTLKIIHQNLLYFAVIVNAAGMGIAAMGYLSPVMAAIVHQGASFLVVLNSLRLLAKHQWADTWLGSRIAHLRHRWAHVRHDLEHLRPDDVRQWYHRNSGILGRVALAAVAFLAINSSVYVVGPDQEAVIRRFGKLVAADVPPGLHATWPWPIGTVTLFRRGIIRRSEIGFRTSESAAPMEPAAYEWNVQHREGRYEKRMAEATVLTGDENLLECNLVVQYVVTDAAAWLFAIADPEVLVRAVAESAARNVFGTHTIDDILTTRRQHTQEDMRTLIDKMLGDIGAGIRVLSVNLQDVHPPLEVVDAFRDVSSALEEKDRMINEAEGYRNAQIPLARGEAAKRLLDARAYTTEKVNRAHGDVDKFRQIARAYRAAPEVTRTRIYLETVETVLAGAKKTILDGNASAQSGRQMFFIDKKILSGLERFNTQQPPLWPPAPTEEP